MVACCIPAIQTFIEVNAGMAATPQERRMQAKTATKQETAACSATGRTDTMHYRRLLLEHEATVRRVVRAIGRRYSLSRDEELDFQGALYLQLLENDCHVLRCFAGRSTFKTYLTVVAVRLMTDTRNHVWGKWRPSTEARRLGRDAIALETLLRRDGFTPDEAITTLAARQPALSEQDVRELAARLPA